MSRIAVVFSLLVGMCTDVTAQPHHDFMDLFMPRATNLAVQYGYVPDQQSDDNPEAEFDQHVYDVALQGVLGKPASALFLPGAAYGFRLYDFADFTGSDQLENDMEELHRLSLTPGGVFFLDRDTAVVGLLDIGAYSNMDGGIKSDDMKYLGDLMLVHTVRTNLQLVFGLALSEDFSHDDVFPLLGLRSVYKNWHFNITLPREVRASYRVNQAFGLYAGGWLRGSEYRVRSDSVRDYDVHVRDTRLGAGADFWIARDIRFTVEAGYYFGDDALELKTDVIPTYSGDLDDAAYARFEIGMFPF